MRELSNGGLSSLLSNLKKGNCARPSMRAGGDEEARVTGAAGFKMSGLDLDSVKLKCVSKRVI